MNISFDNYMKNILVTHSGCWIYPTKTNRVEHSGKSVYIVRAIFDVYGKDYDGRTTTSCGNLNCINPEHLRNRVEQFWSNIEVRDDDSCWEWKSLRGSGEYPTTSYKGKAIRGTKLAYELYYNTKVQDGMFMCHKCDNPPCCNPHHLFVGTHQDNVDDRESKGRNKMPLSRGEEHGIHKLTEKQVKEIRDLYVGGGHSYYTLADKYCVSFGNIRKIIKGYTWGWLK